MEPDLSRLEAPDRSLELDGAALRGLVDEALRRLAPFVDALAEHPATDVDGAAAFARSIDVGFAEEGRPAGELLDGLFERVIPKGYSAAGPGYLAYIPGGGLLATAVADLVADAVNRYVGVWIAAPGLAQLETGVVRWLCRLVGLPEGAGGFLTTGASLASWSALTAARRCRLGDDFGRGVIYASDQSHHSIAKAAVLSGFALERVRSIATDERFCIRVDELRAAVARDRAAGLQPFLVTANAGTTNTGAVDDLAALADVAAEERLWLHVDAAYGGFFLLTERGRALLRGIERADSVVLDPHKGLFLPYGNGSLLVRAESDLRAAFSVSANYLPAMQDDPEFVDFCEVSPELSRDCRGLRVWLPLALHGLGPFRRNLDEKLDLAAFAADELRAIPGLEIVAEPQLSVVAFRHVRTGASADELNRTNRELLERINAGRRVFLTPTVLGGRFVIRICVLNFRTHLDRVRECLSAVRAAVAELD